MQFETHSSGRYMVYSIDIESVHQRAWYPHYVHAAKALFENTGKLICEDLLQQGQSLMSQVRKAEGGGGGNEGGEIGEEVRIG